MAAPACRWRKVPGFVDLVDLHDLHPGRYPHLLESVAHGTPQSRYDILFAFPGETLTLHRDGTVSSDDRPLAGKFLDVFESHWRTTALEDAIIAPVPFHGGWFVYFGYELVREIEPTLATVPVGDNGPVAFAQRFPAAVIRDHAAACVYLVCEADSEQLLETMERDLASLSVPSSSTMDLPAMNGVVEEAPNLHRDRIARALQYIRAGDTYQVNLSRRWQVDFSESLLPSRVYRRLRHANPSPFAALLSLAPGRAIVSSSPERLVAVRDGRIDTRPIAGTFPRSADPDEDRGLPAALTRHPKERAEHIMLVDLERNDLGRLCQPGSVRVDELLTVESYRHVHHLVSNVTGALRESVTPVEVIRAVFPGGTITGCPKVRTMQIIAELENAARGAYTGSAGYINRDGSLDLNILIRTLIVDGSHIEWRAGGGIVADSDPERELRETHAKARGMLAALGLNGVAA